MKGILISQHDLKLSKGKRERTPNPAGLAKKGKRSSRSAVILSTIVAKKSFATTPFFNSETPNF